MRIPFYFFFLFIIVSGFFFAGVAHSEPVSPQVSPAIDFTRKTHLSETRAWLKLLHYQDGWFGGHSSAIAAHVFFIAKDGKSNPQNELETFLSEVLSQDPAVAEEDSLQCRFPARYEFLKEKLGELNLKWPDRSCPNFERWFQTLRGTSISLVFSSYFLNNPSSTFGHTLIRINKAPSSKDGQRYELLDYGVNYAANADKANPLMYALRGLFGGFPGTFTTMPYYYKVREYSNAESRDLWEYDLNVSQKTVDFLVKHIWELGPTYANYWYLSENCSYHMLTLIEAADPNLDLTTHLKKWVIPTDTVHMLYESPGLVKNAHFRPSVRSELLTRAKNLNDQEIQWVAETVLQLKQQPEYKDWTTERQRLALDTAIDDMDYTYSRNVQIPETAEAKFKNTLLSARAAIPEISEPIIVPVPAGENPQLGHGSRRWGLGSFSDSTIGNGYNFRYKFAFHDQLDPILGFPEQAKITFFDMNFFYLQAYQKLDLSQFSLFEVVSMAPYTIFSRSLSWRLNVGIENLVNPSCTGCRAFDITGGPGYTWNLSQNLKTDFYVGLKAGVYSTADANGLISDGTLPRWFAGVGPNFTVKTIWTPHLNSLIEAWYRKDSSVSYQEYKEISLGAQWSPSNQWGLRFSAINRWFENQETLDLLMYY